MQYWLMKTSFYLSEISVFKVLKLLISVHLLLRTLCEKIVAAKIYFFCFSLSIAKQTTNKQPCWINLFKPISLQTSFKWIPSSIEFLDRMFNLVRRFFSASLWGPEMFWKLRAKTKTSLLGFHVILHIRQHIQVPTWF